MHMQYTHPIHNVNKYCAVDTIKGHYFFFHILYILFCLIAFWKKKFSVFYKYVFSPLMKSTNSSEFEIRGNTTGKE